MKKLISVILVIVFVVGSLIISFLVRLKQEQEQALENMTKINNSYQLLGEQVMKYNQVRETLNNYMDSFFYESYLENEESYLATLNDYDRVMKEIYSNIVIMDENCDVIYKDSGVNSICETYQGLYEKLVNLYVSDVKNYNFKITSYNDYKQSSVELYPMLYSEYLDYNKDNIYEGVVSK